MSEEILFPCPCCGEPTMHEQRRGSFEICSVCGWEDDRLQWRDENERLGANRVSLKEARENYKKYGVSDPGIETLHTADDKETTETMENSKEEKNA